MSNPPSVTFVICTYNRANYVNQALDSLLSEEQLNSTEQPFELLVVDNNSSDATREVVKRYQEQFNSKGQPIRYVKETEQGISFARNRGIQETDTPYIVFLDDDISATENFISTWISFFENNPNVSLAGGKIHVKFDDPKPTWMSYFLLPLFGRHDLGKSRKKYPDRKFPFAGNMGVKKSVLNDIGHFDTKYGQRGEKLDIKGEEKELAHRISTVSDAAHYLPDAFVYHHVDKSRLTVKYLKKHAIGIGRGLKKEILDVTFLRRFKILGHEAIKTLGTFVLFLFYLLSLQYSKGKMLVQFRRWIWKGYNDL